MQMTIDTSAIIAVMTSEPTRRSVERVIRRSRMIAPPSLHWEVGNGLANYMNKKGASLDSALAGWRTFERMNVQPLEIDFFLALKLAQQLRIYAYDAYIIQCAIQHKTPLLTLDNRMRACAKVLNLELIGI